MLRPPLSQYITQIMSPCEFSFVHHHPLGPLSLEFRLALCLCLIFLLIIPSSGFFQKFEFKEQFGSSFFHWKKRNESLKEPVVLMKGISKRIMCFQGGSFIVIIY
jgi:hypothetical protein